MRGGNLRAPVMLLTATAAALVTRSLAFAPTTLPSLVRRGASSRLATGRALRLGSAYGARSFGRQGPLMTATPVDAGADVEIPAVPKGVGRYRFAPSPTGQRPDPPTPLSRPPSALHAGAAAAVLGRCMNPAGAASCVVWPCCGDHRLRLRVRAAWHCCPRAGRECVDRPKLSCSLTLAGTKGRSTSAGRARRCTTTSWRRRRAASS